MDRRPGFLKWTPLALSLATCIALGVGALMLATHAWNAVVDYRSPYLSPALPETAAQSEIASRTVLVIVDGLRLDASRTMTSLNRLRTYGADYALTSAQPSLSYPNWTTILSGAPPSVSGVVSNWHDEPASVETLFDTAAETSTSVVFAGPRDFQTLYGVESKTSDSFMRAWQNAYLSDTYVDAAILLGRRHDARLVVVHLPDVDEAGHEFGAESHEYAQAVARVDQDLGRLIDGLQDENTVFVVVADHGHIDSGGHGGWESEVVSVPGVFAGPHVPMGVTGSADLSDVAPTVALIAGIPVPRNAMGTPLQSVAGTRTASPAVTAQEDAMRERYLGVVTGTGDAGADTAAETGSITAAEKERLSADRRSRAPLGFGVLLACVAIWAAIGFMSWRALVAAAAGALAYTVAYNGLFFLVHGYRWSLSAINSESYLSSWMNARLIESAASIVVGAAVAAVVYPLLRAEPKGPRGSYLPGWLTLGPVTALATIAVLGTQVAWYVWWWGIDPVWRLPDLKWGFKFDLDLGQITAIGLAAVVLPLVTYLVGRYHPKVRTSTAQE